MKPNGHESMQRAHAGFERLDSEVLVVVLSETEQSESSASPHAFSYEPRTCRARRGACGRCCLVVGSASPARRARPATGANLRQCPGGCTVRCRDAWRGPVLIRCVRRRNLQFPRPVRTAAGILVAFLRSGLGVQMIILLNVVASV